MNKIHLRVALVFLTLTAVSVAGNAQIVVDDNLACPGAAFSTITSAVAAANPGNTIQICTGTYSEPKIVVDKALSFIGDAPATTFVESQNADILFKVEADDVTFQNLTLRNGSQGLRFELPAGTLTTLRVDNVHFENFSLRAVEIHNDTTVNDLRFDGCHFATSPHGIRIASSGKADGLVVENSTFATQDFGIYVVNGGGSSWLRNLEVRDCDFTASAHTGAGISLEELSGGVIEDNVFANDAKGIEIFKQYTSSGVPLGDIVIRRNQFTDHPQSALAFKLIDSALDDRVVLHDNDITIDTNILAQNFSMIDVRLDGFIPLVHAPLLITRNLVTFTGAFTGSATASYGIKLRGSLTNVYIESNTIAGVGLAPGFGTPPSSGIYIQTHDATYGAMATSELVRIRCNSLSDMPNGISIYDPVGVMAGNIPVGARVEMAWNDVFGHSGFGVDNSGTSELLLASNNWWGDASGPSGLGPGIGDAVSTNVAFTPWSLVAQSNCLIFSAGFENGDVTWSFSMP